MKVFVPDIWKRYSGLPRFYQRLIQVCGLALVADWLLFGYWPGISIVIFIFVLAAMLIATNFQRHEPVRIAGALAALIIAIVPLVEELNLLSLMFALTGIATFSLWMTGSLKSAFDFSIWHPLRLLLNAPFFLPNDLGRVKKRYGNPQLDLGRLAFDWRNWAVAVSVSLVFIFLLIGANPVFEQLAIRVFSFDFNFEFLARVIMHTALWCIAAAFSWGFLRKQKLWAAPVLKIDLEPGLMASKKYLNVNALTKSLILFNLVFALHTMSDALYLWGGAKLPAGLTYAQYAHRGTYSLLATAILAAVFVLVATGPRKTAVKSDFIRKLIYLWVSQTVMMIISALYRLNLYVEYYSLTYARVFAFFVIAVVGIGLVLIIVNIARKKSNRWLINANITVLTLMLYGFAMTNFDYIIAKYNVEHSIEVSGNGRSLDIGYLNRLGAQALPPLLAEFDQFQHLFKSRPVILNSLLVTGDAAVRRKNWRGWGFRHWRLQRLLGQ